MTDDMIRLRNAMRLVAEYLSTQAVDAERDYPGQKLFHLGETSAAHMRQAANTLNYALATHEPVTHIMPTE